MKKRILLLFFCNIFSLLSIAQSFTAQTSKNKVAVGEAFQITYTLNGGGNNFSPPSFRDFNVYSGPNQSSSVSIINGNVNQSVSISYVIAAKKAGKFTIEPATIIINGKQVESNSIAVEASGQAANNQQQNNNQSSSNAGNDADGGENLYAKTFVSKSKVYQGEQITVTQKIFSRFQIVDIRNVKLPDYTGFWTHDDKAQTTINVYNENVKGTIYQIAEIKKTYIFPQHSGNLEIKPFDLECVIRRQSSRVPRDVFEQFFGGGQEDVLVPLKSKPVFVNVMPLPDKDKPKDFSGAVGDYSYKVNLTTDHVKENEAINLKMSISGKGNLKLIEPLKIDFPEDFEVYDPKTTEKISTEKESIGGTKTFDYLIIPRHEGEFKIEPIPFSYFNPETKKYVTIPSPEFTIHVAKGDGSAPTVSNYTMGNKEDVKVLGNDIRHIKTGDVKLKPMNEYFFGSTLFYAALFAPILAFAGFVVVRRKQIEKNSDAIAVKSRKANKIAKKRLVLVEQHLKSNNKELFYSEILKALFGYISDKFNIPSGELNKERIEEILHHKQIDESTIKTFIEIVNNCEYVRYAPSAVSGDLKAVYATTVELITKIEGNVIV